MKLNDDNRLDTLLRSSLTARPEPQIGSDLAARVMAAARSEARAERNGVAQRRTRGERLTWVVALLATVANIIAGALHIVAIRAAAQVTDTAFTTSASSSADTGPLLLVGVVGLGLALIYVALQRSLSNDGDAFELVMN